MGQTGRVVNVDIVDGDHIAAILTGFICIFPCIFIYLYIIDMIIIYFSFFHHHSITYIQIPKTIFFFFLTDGLNTEIQCNVSHLQASSEIATGHGMYMYLLLS
jgi:hypothetical protein